MDHPLQQLMEGDFQTRWEAANHLARIGKPAIAPLIALLEDQEWDWEVRWFAARTLGTFRDPAALEALLRVLQQTPDEELVAIAAAGLSHFGADAIAGLVTLAQNPTHRLTALQALAGIRHADALPPLLIASREDDPQVRAITISALGHFRASEVDQRLLEAVQDPAAAVRQAAITHLGVRPHLLGQEALIEALFTGLWDPHLAVSQASAIALGRLGTETAVAVLTPVLQSPHTPDPLRRSVVKALGWIPKTSAVYTLLSCQQQVSLPIQLDIIETLTQLEAPDLRQRAGAALAERLALLLSDPKAGAVKRAIALALAQLPAPEAPSLLTTLAQDTDEHTRLYAQAALRQLTAQGSGMVG